MDSAPHISPYELLAFYVEAGVDEAIGCDPIDRFSLPPPSARPAAPVQSMAKTAAPVAPMAPSGLAVTSAQLAARCTSLDELRQAMDKFDALPLRQAAMHTVFADGNPAAPVMLIGEAPGYEEDMQGIPFVGRSGKLLDRMLASIGLNRGNDTYITNVLPWRPLDNRTPSVDEVVACLPFLKRHIELVGPRLVLLLGGVAAQAVLDSTSGITRLRGRWHSVTLPGLSQPIPALPTFHPSYLLRTPAGKRLAWRDLIEVRKRLNPPD